MFLCHTCGSTQANTEFTDEVFFIEGKRVLVEHIPVTRCARCGELTFSRETTEQVRRLVHSAPQPVKTIPLDVFAFAGVS
ncbi:MAG TPA: YgiT-type zinc finger protein [Anaerolineae bacterium]|nr:YgiT-type zinc finger protein [Anaerolineae bacterium]HQI87373.1 YgiT-type zinc finger protein [Anaerolineae bacterium]